MAALVMAGLLLAPGEINGDGVGYLKQLRGQELSPGHPLYLPLLRLVALAWQDPGATLLDIAPRLRLLSLCCAALALPLLVDAARLLLGPGRALSVLLLLGASHAFLRSAMELESYAPALTGAVASLWALARGARGGAAWAAAAGMTAGMAAGLHTTLVLLAPALALAPRRRRAASRRALALCVAAATLGVILAWAAWRQGLQGPGELLAWLRSADHGVPYPHGWRTLPAALWGLCRSLVHAPYLHEAATWRVALGTALGAAAWAALVVMRARDTPATTRRLAVAWSAPLALFAVAFFPSDTERWIFVLPGALLLLAPAPGRRTLALAGAMALVNIGLYQVPLSRDTEPARRAAAAEEICGAGDMLISPGHGWEELVGLGTLQPPRVFPLIHHVGAEGGLSAAVASMRGLAAETEAAGGAVYVARLRGSPDPRGFKELAWFGLDREGFADLFGDWTAHPTRVSGLYRLRRRARPSSPNRSNSGPPAP